MQGKERWTSAGEKEAEVVWAKSDGGLLYDWEWNGRHARFTYKLALGEGN